MFQNDVLRTFLGSSGCPHLWLMKISSSTLSSIPNTFRSSFIISFLSWSEQKEARAALKVAWARSVSVRPQDCSSSNSWREKEEKYVASCCIVHAFVSYRNSIREMLNFCKQIVRIVITSVRDSRKHSNKS